MSDERAQTFWNYQPVPCRRVRVIVGPCEKETYWHNGLEGTEREAVEVNYPGEARPFYLDNEDGSGWAKVTNGGGPDMGHKSLPVERVVSVVLPILPGLLGGKALRASTGGEE